MKTKMIMGLVIIFGVLLAPCVALGADSVTIVCDNLRGDSIWYDGTATPGFLNPYTTFPFELECNADTNLMAFSVQIGYPSTKLQCLTEQIAAGSFLTGSNADSCFFNVSIDTDASSGTLSIVGSRMDATLAEKSLTGDALTLATNVQFWRSTTTTLEGDSFCVLGGTLKFRNQFNSTITTVNIDPYGFYLKAKPLVSDVDRSGSVGVGDALAAIAKIGQATNDNPEMDVDFSGATVGVGDVLAIIADIGQTDPEYN